MISLGARVLLNRLGGENPSEIENIWLYSINTSFIGQFDEGLKDKECRKKIISFMTEKEMWRSMKDVFAKEWPNEKFSKQVMVKEYSGLRSDHEYEWDLPAGKFLDLSEPLVVKRNEYIDKDYFDYFFAYRLCKKDLNRIVDFLNYNLLDHFFTTAKKDIDEINRAIKKYCDYLADILLKKHSYLIGADREHVIKKYIRDTSLTSQQNETLLPTHHALIICIETFSGEKQRPTKKQLEDYAKKNGIGKEKIYKNLRKWEEEFKDTKDDAILASRLQEVIPFLGGKAKIWAQSKIKELSLKY